MIHAELDKQANAWAVVAGNLTEVMHGGGAGGRGDVRN